MLVMSKEERKKTAPSSGNCDKVFQNGCFQFITGEKQYWSIEVVIMSKKKEKKPKHIEPTLLLILSLCGNRQFSYEAGQIENYTKKSATRQTHSVRSFELKNESK